MIDIEIVKGREVQFHHDTHTYYVDQVAVPSVTQVIKEVLPNPYETIAPQVLRQAANRGISLHKEIELYEETGIKGHSREFRNYLKLKNRHNLQTIHNEKMIFIEHEGKVLCAGRLDMVIKMYPYEGHGLGDVKRTYKVLYDHLKLQLNLYKIGYEQCYGEDIAYMKCIHLRNDVSEIIDVQMDTEYAIRMLLKYHETSLK